MELPFFFIKMYYESNVEINTHSCYIVFLFHLYVYVCAVHVYVYIHAFASVCAWSGECCVPIEVRG